MTDTKQDTQSVVEVSGARLIVRGNLPGEKARVRRVKTLNVPDEQIMDVVAEELKKLVEAESLENVSYNISPMAGFKLDGSPSKGHEVVDGVARKVKAETATA